MQNKQCPIVYFQCNDWDPCPEEAERFIYNYLEGYLYPEEETTVCKTLEEVDKWERENELCIHFTTYDMSVNYWVSCKKSWLEQNFPELLPDASEEPEDFMWKGDKKFFPKYCLDNFGEYFIKDTTDEEYEKVKSRCI